MRLDLIADQGRRRRLGDTPPMIDDQQPVAEPLGLVHEMRGEHDGLALCQQALQALPDQVTGLRIKSGSGFVEKEHRRIVDQRTRNGQAPAHATRQLLDLRVALACQLREIQQHVDAPARNRIGLAKVAAEDEQVLGNGEVRIERVVLRHHADPDPCLAGALRHRQAEQFDAARIRLGQAERELERRALAGTIGPEQAKALAAGHLETQAIDCALPAEGLYQAAHPKHRSHRRAVRCCQGG